MKYAIITCTTSINSSPEDSSTKVCSFTVNAEYETFNSAKIGFHQLCAALWNEPSVCDSEIRIMDEDLATVAAEHIHHEAVNEG